MELCNPVNMNYVFFTFTEFNLISASNQCCKKQNKSTSNSVSLYVYNPCPYLKPFHSIIGVLSWDRYILTQYFHKPDISSYKAGLVRKPPTLRHQLMCLKTFYSKFVSTFHKLLIFFPPLHWRCIQCNQEETKSVCVYINLFTTTLFMATDGWIDNKDHKTSLQLLFIITFI